MRDADQLASSVAFLHLTVDQAWLHLPPAHVPSSTTQCKPLAKVGGEGIEVEIEAITGEVRKAAWGQDLSERVNEHMCHGLCAGAELKYRKNFGEGIDRQPEPEHLCGTAQPGSQFVQLQMRELEVAEIALVQGLRMLASARQPGGDGG